MNVLVLTTMTPFVHGRTEELTHHLVRNMKLQGVNAEAMRLPFRVNSSERLLDEIFLFKSLKIFNVDRVVALGFPAYLVPFDSKTCWLLDSHPQSYDHFDELEAVGEGEFRSRYIKNVVLKNDARAFRSSKRLFAGSEAVRTRIRRHHGIEPAILLPPLCDPERFISAGDDGYILAAGRIDGTQRHSLLIDAMKLLPSDAKLVIAGIPDSSAEVGRLREQVGGAGLEARVKLDLRALSRDDLAGLVGRARAVACLSVDADPADWLVMEAFEASKPLLTTTDAGGICNVVRHGEIGIVCQPSAEALAEGMAELLGSSSKAEGMGAAGHELWRSIEVNWSTTIEHLLE